MTDFRALCTDLADELHGYKVANPMHCRALLDRALTALAEGAGPTDEELYDLWDQEGHEADFQECRRFARAVLARYGTHPQAPIPVADGAGVGVTDEEWKQLKKRLWDKHKTMGYLGEKVMWRNDFDMAMDEARAALAEGDGVGWSDKAWQEFIEQLQHVQHVALGEGAGPRFDLVEFALEAWRSTTNPRPIPVAERPWEREGFCDAEGRCWVFHHSIGVLVRPDSSLGDAVCFPAAAIPLPEVGS